MWNVNPNVGHIITDKGIPQFKEIDGFKCELLSNRGTKVWPCFVSPDLMLVNWYRCRFMATRQITDSDINKFMEKLNENYWWSAVQKLWNYGGEPGYSKAY